MHENVALDADTFGDKIAGVRQRNSAKQTSFAAFCPSRTHTSLLGVGTPSECMCHAQVFPNVDFLVDFDAVILMTDLLAQPVVQILIQRESHIESVEEVNIADDVDYSMLSISWKVSHPSTDSFLSWGSSSWHFSMAPQE